MEENLKLNATEATLTINQNWFTEPHVEILSDLDAIEAFAFPIPDDKVPN